MAKGTGLLPRVDEAERIRKEMAATRLALADKLVTLKGRFLRTAIPGTQGDTPSMPAAKKTSRSTSSTRGKAKTSSKKPGTKSLAKKSSTKTSAARKSSAGKAAKKAKTGRAGGKATARSRGAAKARAGAARASSKPAAGRKGVTKASVAKKPTRKPTRRRRPAPILARAKEVLGEVLSGAAAGAVAGAVHAAVPTVTEMTAPLAAESGVPPASTGSHPGAGHTGSRASSSRFETESGSD